MKKFGKEDILMEDQEILVVHKHAGMAVQSARPGQMDLEHALLNYLAASGSGRQARGVPYLGVIHRLDQPVEGILVFAKSPSAAASLNRALQKNQMEKIYLAVTDRKPERNEGILVDYLRKDGRKNISCVVSEKDPEAKRAELFYRLMDGGSGLGGERYLMEIRLKTGRHHQIRVQMSHAGMPLMGDEKYHPDAGTWTEKTALALCASRLSFPHPKTGRRLLFEVQPEGEEFQRFQEKS